MSGRKIRKAAHVLFFVVAAVVFYIGLGVGLQYDPNLGTLLWATSGAIVVLNVLSMRRRDG